jgi:hypothetical protein
MKKIYKYVLTGSGKSYPTAVNVPMPIGAKVLSVGNQLEKICIWAEVESTSPTEGRAFVIYNTGEVLEMIDHNNLFIGTVVLKGGTAVAHVFEVISTNVELSFS